MKTKLIITSVVIASAFLISGFKTVDKNQDYIQIHNNDFKNQELYVSKTVINCAKCHNCQQKSSIEKDSIHFNSKSFLQSLNPDLIKISVKESTIDLRKGDSIFDGEQNNFKNKL